MYNTYFYLASPYSSKDLNVQKKRGDDVTAFGAKLVKAGVLVYAPITTSRELVVCEPSLSSGFETWRKIDLTFVKLSSGVIVYKLEGWEKSVGVTEEILFARERHLDIFYVDPQADEANTIDLLKMQFNRAERDNGNK
mgnify:CR=1 FL=1